MNEDRKAAAEEMDALKGTDRELEGLTPIHASIARQPRAVFSLRMSTEELDEISRAALALRQNVSEYVRLAALEKARAGEKGDLVALGQAMDGAFKALSRAYVDAGQPYGESIGGMERWLDDAVPPRGRRSTARAG